MNQDLHLVEKASEDGLAALAGQGQPNGFDLFETAGVVHDLGNLIQIASAGLSVMSRRDTFVGSQEPILTRALEALNQAGVLVRETLRQAHGRARSARTVSVAACLFDIRALVDSMHDPKFRLELAVEARLPKVRCDPLALQNAILNLVYNARDAMPDGGTVIVRAGRLVVGRAHSMVEVIVADTGIGMSPETVVRAFEPFFTTKSDGLGGIGLPMVERFVREASGEMAIDSEPGFGTAVTVRLPAVAEAALDDLPVRSNEEGMIP
jgi:signal transduction histidine kinase